MLVTSPSSRLATELPDLSGDISNPGGLASPPSSEAAQPRIGDGLDDSEGGLEATTAWLAPVSASSERRAGIVDRALAQLNALAADPARFFATLEEAFGPTIDRAAAEEIRRKLLAGDTSWLPDIQFASADELGGARGAYAGDRGTVYLSDAIRSPKRAAEVLIEELGHHLDKLLNRSDAAGDEGEIFRRLVAGETLSDLDLSRLRAENDHGTMHLGAEVVEVENWGLPRWIVPWFLKSKPVQDTIEATKQNLLQYFGGLDERIKAAAKGWLDHIVANAKAYGPELLKSMQTVAVGFSKLASGDVAGGLAEIGKGITSATIESTHALARLTLDTITAVQTALGIEPIGRKITGDEEARLRAIYGDSIDYSKVTIKEGDVGAFFGPRALTMGNTIYVKAHTSFATLAHEMGHVWQFQNGGNDYMLKAGAAQLWNYLKGNKKEVAYDWTRDITKGWAALNPEQQAEMMESIVRANYLEDKAALSKRWADYNKREAEYQARYGGKTTLRVPGGLGMAGGVVGNLAARNNLSSLGGTSGLGLPGNLLAGSVTLIDAEQIRARRALDAERAALDATPPVRFMWNGQDYTDAAEDALWRVRNGLGAP